MPFILLFIVAGANLALLTHIHTAQRKYMATVEQLSGKIDTISASVAKISAETSTSVSMVADLQTEVQSLKDQIAAGQPVDLTALSDKIDALEAQVQGVDDLVPDVTAPTEPTDPSAPVDPTTPAV